MVPSPLPDAAALTPEAIASAALRLIDAEGIDKFSMRRLGAELNATTGAIYWHFADRTAVLAAAAAQVVQSMDLPDDELPWDQWLIRFAKDYRQLIHQHPHMSQFIHTELSSNSRSEFPMMEAVLSHLSRAGFRDEALVDAYNVCVAFVSGFIVIELSQPPRENVEEWRAGRISDLDSINEDLPYLASVKEHLPEAFIVRWKSGSERPLDRAFDAGLSVLIDGLRAMRRKRAAEERAQRGSRSAVR